MEKLSRARRKEFVSYKGHLIEARKTGPDCGSRKKCMESFTDDEKETIINTVYNGRPKNEKDTYLLGLIERLEVARHLPSKAESKQFSSSFKYNAMKVTSRTEVCRKAFMLYQIKLWPD